MVSFCLFTQVSRLGVWIPDILFASVCCGSRFFCGDAILGLELPFVGFHGHARSTVRGRMTAFLDSNPSLYTFFSGKLQPAIQLVGPAHYPLILGQSMWMVISGAPKMLSRTWRLISGQKVPKDQSGWTSHAVLAERPEHP
jgi:hypothetical protein